VKSAGSEGAVIIERGDFPEFLQTLAGQGYQVLGPKIENSALVYTGIASDADLPIGWGDEQDGGRFRLGRARPEALFDFSVGQHSWKQFLLLPKLRLWQAQAGDERFHAFRLLPQSQQSPSAPSAFVGVRACDLAAIAIQDRICSDATLPDTEYAARRKSTFIVAVNCTNPCGTCFCASMGAGPRATAGYDIALTEILEGNRHYFLAQSGTDRGREILAQVKHRPAADSEREAAERVIGAAAGRMGRVLDTFGIKELLYRNLEHPRWDEVVKRCLTCGNCTLVCPTCFCVEVEDYTSLDGKKAERVRSWYSCFSLDHSYIHGGPIRASAKSRYRQWMTHKLATWIDQFGMSGCVGCGRCITWCPVGIDITEEAAAIRAGISEGRGDAPRKG
jgi:sulfhydrogenase subunit beta (sulfur reductase)